MHEPGGIPHRGWPLSFGQMVCLFAIGVGLLMLVAASYQRVHPDIPRDMVGRWDGIASFSPPSPVQVLYLDADGTARYATELLAKKGQFKSLRWNVVGGRLNIEGASADSTAPIVHSARVSGDEFRTDDYRTFRKVWGASSP